MGDYRGQIRAANVPLETLAERSGLRPDRIAHILDGDEPTMAELRALTAATGTSMASMLDNGTPEANLLFRREAATRSTGGTDARPASTRKRLDVDAAVSKLKSIVSRTLEAVGPSEPPSWIRTLRPREQTYVAAEQCALAVRGLLLNGDNYSPLLELPQLVADELGVFLFIPPSISFDGASALVEGRPFIFVSPRFRPRMLFTLAHELGHLIAHHVHGNGFSWIDFDGEVGSYTNQSSSLDEKFADAFASYLLLPTGGVATALQRIRAKAGVPRSAPVGDVELLFIAHIFGVSFHAAARRCEELTLIPRGGAQSLSEHLRKSHKSPEQRAREVGVPERLEVFFPGFPQSLMEQALRRIEAAELSIGRASALLGASMESIMDARATWNGADNN